MSVLIDESGAPIETKKRAMPSVPRSERRRMRRDPMFQAKVAAGSEHVEPYHRLIAFGQIILNSLSDVQWRMAGVPRARGRRPIGQRDELSMKLALEWEALVDKLERVQKEMSVMEEQSRLAENPHLEADVYGLC